MKNFSSALAIHDQERVGTAANLCGLKLAVHGLKSGTKTAITQYVNLHIGSGWIDFPLANGPND